MKTKILFLISILVVSGFLVGLNVLAQEEADTVIEEAVAADEEITAEDLEVRDPTILPDSPFYPVKNFWWKVRTKLTFNPVKKAKLQLKIASTKLLEAKKLARKTGKEEILKRGLQNYQGEMEIVQNRIEAFKEKAKDNPKIDKFLDKYTDKVVKHQRLMDRLEKQLLDKPEILEKIRENKERTLEHFGEVINRLEEKDKIPERLEKNLKNIKGSKYKNFKNLEVLMRLENKVPEQAKEAIQKAQENALKRLHGNLEQMSPEDQEKFGDYLEKVSGEQDLHLKVIEKLKEQKGTSEPLKRVIEQNKEQVKERVENIKKNTEQIREKIQERKEQPKEQGACMTLWDPVCGKDGKTYSNACFAKLAGVEVAYKGKCEAQKIRTRQ